MSDGQGVKPTKMKHWIGIAVVAAVVWHNPGGSAELAITALDKLGGAISFGMNSAGFDGESDYFVEKTPADTADGGGAGSGRVPPTASSTEQPPASSSTDTFDTLAPLNGSADQAVIGIVRLHEIVEAVFAEEAVTS